MKLEGTITKGRLVIDPAIWAIAMREFEGRPVVLEIDVRRQQRTVKQNKRYWTVLVPLAIHRLSLGRPLPFNKDEVHRLLVTAFGGSEETPLGLVPVRTRTMTVDQFLHLTQQTELWLREQGYSIPEGPDMTVAAAIDEAMA